MNSYRYGRRIRLMLALPFVTLILCAFSSCHREPRRLHPYGWTLTDTTFDSLTREAESAFMDMKDDSVIAGIIDMMQLEMLKDSAAPEKKSRLRYWEARFRLRHGEIDEAMKGFGEAIALTDSARFPYDIARIRWNMDLDEPDDAEGYFDAVDKIRLFAGFNDLPMQAAYYMTLGGLMNNIGNASLALGYFEKADSLLHLSGLEGTARRNVINHARTLEVIGREDKATALLKDALRDSVFLRENIAVNIAQWNLYLMTDSLPWLLDAYHGLAGDLDEQQMRPVYGAFLVKEYARQNNPDSVRKYLAIVNADTANISTPIHWRDYYIGTAEAFRLLGDYEKSADAYSHALEMMNILDTERATDEISALDNQRKINEAIHRGELQKRERTLWLLAGGLILTIISGAVIMIYRRRLALQREARLQASLQHEQARQRVLALEIAMEENRRLSDELRMTVDNLEKKGLMNSEAGNALETTLRSHNLTQPARDSFVEVFSEVNPRFLEAMDERYPNLSKAERRLATYIAVGLDSKHISRITGVRPESVKQARWRLRNKLELPKEISLEEALRSLVDEVSPTS